MKFPKLFKCDDEINEKWLSVSRILVFTLLIALGIGFVIFNWFYKFIPPIWVNMSNPNLQYSILEEMFILLPSQLLHITFLQSIRNGVYLRSFQFC